MARIWPKISKSSTKCKKLGGYMKFKTTLKVFNFDISFIVMNLSHRLWRSA